MTKRYLLSLLLLIPAASLLAQAPKKLPLDGKKFTAEIMEEGKKKPLDPDDLSFNMGKFKSALFVDWGYNKGGKYEVTKIDSTTTEGVKIYSWVVDLTNEGDEKLAWSGTVSGEDIEGTIELINKKGQTKKNYNFSGKMKKKAGQK